MELNPGAKRIGLKIGFTVVAASPFDGPILDAIAAGLWVKEYSDLAQDVADIKEAVSDVRAAVDSMIECEKESDKQDGLKAKGKKDKCEFLEGKNQTKDGKYHGGKHGTLQKGGNPAVRQSHHMPSWDSYPKGSPSKNNLPAIQMETADHVATASHNGTGSSLSGKVYRKVQKEMMKRGMLPVVMAMDILDIKIKFGNKYDDAITEMILWSVCKGYL